MEKLVQGQFLKDASLFNNFSLGLHEGQNIIFDILIFTIQQWIQLRKLTFKTTLTLKNGKLGNLNAFIQATHERQTLNFQKSLCYLRDWEPYKNDEKCFSIRLKSFFVLKISKNLSEHFGHVGRTVWLERLTSKFVTSQTALQNFNTHVAQYLTK